MLLLEHEAKALINVMNVPIPASTLITKNPAIPSRFPVVLKSQVPVGGRGKLGGVIVVESPMEFGSTVEQLFALEIKGYKPTVLLAEEKLPIAREHYLSLLIDRNSSTIRLIAHHDGGVEVEQSSSADFFNIAIDESSLGDAADQLATYLGYKIEEVTHLLTNLYHAFIQNDATLLEINPLVYTTAKKLVCGDCKMELDDAAAFRHAEWDFENKLGDTNFVSLDPQGTVATIANGAGLAMATVDAVTARGMKPANFLDIGGGANVKSVLKAFQRIMEFPNVEAIVINIFAGITRCDEVARAIIQAREQIDSLPPLFIRLAGTNFKEAEALLASEGIPTLLSLDECLTAARETTNG